MIISLLLSYLTFFLYLLGAMCTHKLHTAMGDDVVDNPSEWYINEWSVVPPPIYQLVIVGIT